MRQNSKLQVPVTNKLKKDLEKKAEYFGFSSVNDVVRLLVHNFVNGNITIQFVQPTFQLGQSSFIPTVDFETEQRIARSMQEIKQGNYDLIDFEQDPNVLKKLLK